MLSSRSALIVSFCRKSKELLRLISMKNCTCNETAKMIICIHCAASLCNSEFNMDDAVRLSGLKKKEYVRQKELIEKLLEVGKKLTFDEICAQLEINDLIKKDAVELLKMYNKTKFLTDGINNAQYLAMAIYKSYEIRKYKTNNIKTKLIHLSRLSTKVWKSLENEWTSWIENTPDVLKHVKMANAKTTVEDHGIANIKKEIKSNKINKIHFKFSGNTLCKDQKNDGDNIIQIEPEIQPYEEWRENIIIKTKAELKRMQ